jgi:hypothetical protein
MCRQVAKALAESDYEKLPPGKKAGLKLHVLLCAMCGKYHRQVMDLQDGVRGFLAHEEDDDLAPELHLSEEAKHRIEAAVHQD